MKIYVRKARVSPVLRTSARTILRVHSEDLTLHDVRGPDCSV